MFYTKYVQGSCAVTKAAKIVVVLLVLVCVSSRHLMAAETDTGARAPKSVAAGLILGAIGLSTVPGLFGLGNAYAGDLRGFLILNIGGSACSLIGYGCALFLVLDLWGGFLEYPEALEVLAIAGIGGAYGFGIASAIWGAIAVAARNERMASTGSATAKEHRVGLRLLPASGGLALEIAYRY